MRMSELLNEVRRFSLDEGFSPREIKMAIGIASDPRYAKGNMTGAVNAIEKMKKGLSDHPQVAAVLKRQNEKVETDEAVSPAQQAAIAISKKEKGEKPKDERDEGNEFGMALKSARDKGEKTFVVSGKKYNVTEEGEASRIVEPYRPEFGLDEAPKMTYALVGTDMKIYAIGDEKEMNLNRRSLEKRLKDVSPLKIARLKTAQSIGDKVDKSQLKEEVEIDESMKMTDPKLLKMFDKLKSKDTVKIKYDSTLEKGTDFIEFTVKSKGTVRNGQVEKITLAAKGNPTGAKRFMYKKDGKVTFATGDMAASIVDIKESIKRALLKLESVNEGTWAMPDSSKKLKGLIQVLKKPIPLGKGGDSAIDVIGNFIGDDELYDDLGDEGDKNPKGDARPFIMKAMKRLKITQKNAEVELGEKYDLYHKDFSDAMQHAYSYAKSKMGITVDPKEIDSKVATGPKKPSEGKTNTYKLKGKGGNLQIQVYNKGGSKPFELNMYKEENALIPESNDLISQTVNLITYTQMQEKQDYADVDDDASQKDVDDAAKNIIMQLRKSVSMRGDKEVEFAAIGHGYKKKVDMKIAQKALDMYNKMKPQDKTKFQTTIAKSYKDLLNAIKGN